MFPTGQDEIMLRGELEHKLEKGNLPPRRGPGDWCILLGAIAGIAAGTYFGLKPEKPLFLIIGFIGGGIVGVVIGSLFKNLILRRPKQ